ncbi:hypothetical protein FOA52_011504 [Chlamydomonas sp. UWO 241]|nr:hypothetical protein FOA52_011504 [Chlamydomonas sp. UWO 241]
MGMRPGGRASAGSSGDTQPQPTGATRAEPSPSSVSMLSTTAGGAPDVRETRFRFDSGLSDDAAGSADNSTVGSSSGGSGGSGVGEGQSPPRPLSLSAVLTEPLSGRPGRGGGSGDGSVPPPVAILCHGFASRKDCGLLTSIAHALCSEGVACLRFDFRGNGESEGEFRYANYMLEVADLRAAVELVRGPLDRRVAAVVGHSKGGNVVLLYGGKYDDVPLVVNLSGRYDLAAGVMERFGPAVLEELRTAGWVRQATRNGAGKGIVYKLTQQDLDGRLALDMHAAAAAIKTSRVLTVHGSADPVIPVGDAHEFAAVIPNHALVVVEGADHVFRAPEHMAACVDAVVAGVLASMADVTSD